ATTGDATWSPTKVKLMVRFDVDAITDLLSGSQLAAWVAATDSGRRGDELDARPPGPANADRREVDPRATGVRAARGDRALGDAVTRPGDRDDVRRAHRRVPLDPVARHRIEVRHVGRPAPELLQEAGKVAELERDRRREGSVPGKMH